MFVVLLISYIVNAMDRQIFAVLASDVRQEYGFSLASVGLLSTVFTLGMALAGLPVGYLVARYSRKSVILLGIGIYSVGTILTAFSIGYWDMFLYRASTGIGEAMQLTVLLTIGAVAFARHRGAAVGSVNFCFGIGAFIGPAVGGDLLIHFGSWRAPLIVYGILGVVSMAAIAWFVRPRFSEQKGAVQAQASVSGAMTLLNRNSVILAILSVIGGLVIYAYLGMYPTFLRESLGYAPTTAGYVFGLYGVGALLSIGGGWLGDRLSPRLVIGGSFLGSGVVGLLLFHGPAAVAAHAALSFMFGVLVSALIYVNLAAYHVKAVQRGLAARGSGLFVTSFYVSSAVAGYLMGWLAGNVGWVAAGDIQIVSLSVIGSLLALMLRPEQMSA